MFKPKCDWAIILTPYTYTNLLQAHVSAPVSSGWLSQTWTLAVTSWLVPRLPTALLPPHHPLSHWAGVAFKCTYCDVLLKHVKSSWWLPITFQLKLQLLTTWSAWLTVLPTPAFSSHNTTLHCTRGCSCVAFAGPTPTHSPLGPFPSCLQPVTPLISPMPGSS